MAHPGTIRRRGDAWQVILRLNGQRVQLGPRDYPELRDLRTKAEVEEWAWREFQELKKKVKRRRRGLPDQIRVKALLDEFERDELPALRSKNTRDSYAESIRRFRAYFVDELEDPVLDDIGRREIKSFLRWRGRQKSRNGGTVSTRTVAKDFRVLRRVLSWAVDMEYLEANPAQGVKEPKADKRNIDILTPAQYEAMIEACGDRHMLRLYVFLLGESGVRAYSEALHLKWTDVDLAGGFIHVVSGRDGHRTKSGKSRYVPMTPRLVEAVREHFARYRLALYQGRRSEWIFHHTRTRPKRGSRRGYKAGARIQSFRGPFATAKQAAKLPATFRLHDLRHRRVTVWLAEGKPAALVQEAMGHSSLDVTNDYKHLAKQHLLALVNDEPDRRALKELAK